MYLQKSQNGVIYLGAGMNQYDPNRQIDIGREHAFTVIKILDFSHVLFFIKKRNVSDAGFCLCLQVNAYSVGSNRQIYSLFLTTGFVF